MELKLNLILYIVAASLVITGCVSVESVSTSSQDSTSKSQEQETEVGYRYEFGDSDTEVLYFPHTVTDVNLYKDDVAISNNLFLTNLTDGTHTSLLCQIPGCIHDENIADCPYNKYYNLDYWLPGIENSIFISYNSDSGYEEIYCVAQDGQIKFLLSSENTIIAPDCAIKVDDVWYFFLVEEEKSIDKDGNVETNYAKGYFYSFDTVSGNLNLLYKTETYREISTAYPNFNYDNGKLILQYNLKKKNLEEAGITQEEYEASLEEDNWMELWTEWFDMDCPILIYDIDEETTELLKGFAYDDILAGAWDGKLIFYDGEDFGNLYLYDIETRQSVPWLTKNDYVGRYTVIQWADFLCIEMRSSDSALKECAICFRNDLTVHMLNSPYQKNVSFLSEDSSKLYIELDPISEDFDMDEAEYKLIDKNEILSWIDDSYTFGSRIETQ